SAHRREHRRRQFACVGLLLGDGLQAVPGMRGHDSASLRRLGRELIERSWLSANSAGLTRDILPLLFGRAAGDLEDQAIVLTSWPSRNLARRSRFDQVGEAPPFDEVVELRLGGVVRELRVEVAAEYPRGFRRYPSTTEERLTNDDFHPFSYLRRTVRRRAQQGPRGASRYRVWCSHRDRPGRDVEIATRR